MIAVDIVQVSLSSHNSCYFLVTQDYFTKWVKATPYPDQTAKWIIGKPVKVFVKHGVPSQHCIQIKDAILRATWCQEFCIPP